MSIFKNMDNLDKVFVIWAFFFQVVLIVHFAIRKPLFESYTVKYGWMIYALSIPAVIISIILLRGGKSWSFWLGGFLFVLFAVFGYYIDYVLKLPWRNPLQLRIMFPYVFFYLGTLMFYWWPMGMLSKPLWYVYAVLFVTSVILNVTSH